MEQDSKKIYTESGPKRVFSLFVLAGIILGAIGGFLYYYFIGCMSGACLLKSNPWIATILGAVMGYLLAGIIKPLGKKKSTD